MFKECIEDAGSKNAAHRATFNDQGFADIGVWLVS
jgi:hypothetical protein